MNRGRDNRRNDGCIGDSGGPYVCQVKESDMPLKNMKAYFRRIKEAKGSAELFVQYGLTSWSTRCGEGNPSVYTKISSFRTWILETMKFDSLRDPSEPWNKYSNKVIRSRSAQIYPCRPVFRKHKGEKTKNRTKISQKNLKKIGEDDSEDDYTEDDDIEEDDNTSFIDGFNDDFDY